MQGLEVVHRVQVLAGLNTQLALPRCYAYDDNTTERVTGNEVRTLRLGSLNESDAVIRHSLDGLDARRITSPNVCILVGMCVTRRVNTIAVPVVSCTRKM